MLTINKLIPQARGLAPVLVKRAATIELDWDVRQKSRFDATDSTGRPLGVFLPRGTLVRGGDVLIGEDGSLVMVHAAPQPVLVVRHCPDHGVPFDLLRAAYHLGNRHVPLELTPDHLKLEPDHVLAEMLRQMHLIVTAANEAFEPEGGAYAAGGHGMGMAWAWAWARARARARPERRAGGCRRACAWARLRPRSRRHTGTRCGARPCPRAGLRPWARPWPQALDQPGSRVLDNPPHRFPPMHCCS